MTVHIKLFQVAQYCQPGVACGVGQFETSCADDESEGSQLNLFILVSGFNAFNNFLSTSRFSSYFHRISTCYSGHQNLNGLHYSSKVEDGILASLLD